MSELNIRGIAKSSTKQGPDPASDTGLFTTGQINQVDPAGARVQITVQGGTVWLPANAARYFPNALARVRLDPISSRPVLVDGAVTPRPTAILAPVAATGAGTITVTIDGAPVVINAASGTYTVGQSAWILLDDWGTPILALGPNAATNTGGGSSGGGGGGGGSTVSATATIGPQDSGTYRSGYGWDSWNTDRYGGRSDIYQGNAYGSGLLVGWAGYGDQVANLGAVAITEIRMSAMKTDTNGLSAALTVQGTAAGTRPPSPVGGPWGLAATGPIGPGAWGELALPAALCEAFRTGAAKGLAAVGGDYGGFGGTGTPGSFVLRISYTKNA